MVKAKRVAIYLRVSTGDQTVENQQQALQRVAVHRGWQVVETYTDHGISGSKGRDKRPALDKMLKDAQRGRFDLIAAWSLDRLGRSVVHLVNMLAELTDQGVGVYLDQQNIDSSTAAGKAMLGMCAVFAEFERGTIVERVKAGMKRAANSGTHCGRPTLPESTRQAIVRALVPGASYRAIGKQLKVSDATVRRVARTLAA
jgi:DNA invertase Pin-like site-specific DNA recombinase